MKITVKARGFDKGADAFRQSARSLEPVVSKELQRFGDEWVAKLQTDARAGLFGPPKARDDGKPPLIDSGKYIESYRAQAEGMQLTIGPTGNNDHMSNEDLADVLEYGIGNIPARPHIRPMTAWAETQLPTLARRIVNALLRNH